MFRQTTPINPIFIAEMGHDLGPVNCKNITIRTIDQ